MRIQFEIFSPQVYSNRLLRPRQCATKMSVSNRDPATNQLEEFKKKKGVSYTQYDK